MSDFEKMNNDYLRKIYVPDVYQKSVFNIDYDKLKEAGIKLISFDIDDTIAPIEKSNPDKEILTFFGSLKQKGFDIYILSNANYDRVKNFGNKLGIEAIPRAQKPQSEGFETLKKLYYEKHGIELSPKEMAHIGNNIITDVAGGNSFGTVTCLVRNFGKFIIIVSKIRFWSEGKQIRKELLKRDIWRKHHLNEPDDQYYQLGEKQVMPELPVNK